MKQHSSYFKFGPFQASSCFRESLGLLASTDGSFLVSFAQAWATNLGLGSGYQLCKYFMGFPKDTNTNFQVS